MSGPSRDDDETAPQPWHVPQVPEDAVAQELPPELAEAARRALGARRPGVKVADFVERHSRSVDGCSVSLFFDGEVSVALRTSHAGPDMHLHISCRARPGATVEVMHAGATLHTELDETGSAEVPVAAGLISVLIKAGSGTLPSVQTSWLRVG